MSKIAYIHIFVVAFDILIDIHIRIHVYYKYRVSQT